MAVVITKNPAYWAPGHCIVPDQPGQPLVFKFKARFKRLNEEERKALDQRIHAGREYVRALSRALLENQPAPPQPTDQITDKEVLDLVLVDWDGFKNDDGSVAIYTPAARAQVVFDNPGLEGAFVRAYLESRDVSQDLAAAEKNSEALPATA